MGNQFSFYDYVDEAGQNQIRAWFDSIGAKPKAKLNSRILYLAATPPGQWNRPLVDTLTGECEGLFEIRAQVGRVQYRLLGFHGTGERQVTLVFGARERNDRFEPLSACRQAQRRKAQVEQDPERHRRVHDFGSAPPTHDQPRR